MLYSLFPVPLPISNLGCWESELPTFTHVVGYSGIGHFFLFNEVTREYAVLHPYRQAYKSYGIFESATEFDRVVLSDEAFAEYVLKPEHQASIRRRLGPLQPEEVYIACPYPFLGGTEEPDSYMKGNAWAFAELVGLSHGFADA